MGKPHPMALRERVVAYVQSGHTHRAAALHYDVSPKFVNDMMKLVDEQGSLEPKVQGNTGVGKLMPYQTWVEAQIKRQPDLTLDELVADLAEQKGLVVHRSSMGRLLHRLGLTHKKKTSKPWSKDEKM